MDNPLVVGPPHIRFYAGAPLVTSNGMRLGSLCVIDTQPCHLDAEQLMVLANFAEVVVREIEKDIARVRWPHSSETEPGCARLELAPKA
jgi:GAF domain-containing protein